MPPRIAVVTDIHANLTALEAVIADLRDVAPDLVVVGGDLVGSGSRPAAVIDRVRERGWAAIQGNSDEMLWNTERVNAFFSAPSLRPWRGIVDRTIEATTAAIGDARVAWLRALPMRWTHDHLTVVHASHGDAWVSPGPGATDEELMTTYGQLTTSRVVYGHVHHGFIRPLPGMIVANAGSVSLAYDGDPRAAYAIVDDEISIRRVEYDIEREIASLIEHKCPDAEWIAAMLRAGTPLPAP